MIIKDNNILRKIDFANERELQHFFENRLKEILKIDFVTSEFSVDKYRIDTLAFDQEKKSFRIIEYKNVKNVSLVDQGFAYLNLMHTRKADFVLKYNEINNTTFRINDIDWSQSRIIFISTHFSSYQIDATSFKNMPFDLYEVSKYEHNIVNIVEHSKKSNIKIDDFIDEETKYTMKEITVYTEEDHLKNKSEEIIDLYHNLKNEMLELGDIKIDPMKLYIAFKGNRNIIDVEVQNKKLKIHINLKKGSLKDPENKTIDQSNSGHWGNGDYRIEFSDFKDKEYIMYLFKQSYNFNK